MLEEAMEAVTAWVFRRHQRQLGNWRSPPRGMIDSSSRSAVIHTFVHLTHSGRIFNPAELRAWARERGWPDDDADIMRDYAQGVKAGVRYHAVPPPFVPDRFDEWVKHSEPVRLRRRTISDPPSAAVMEVTADQEDPDA